MICISSVHPDKLELLVRRRAGPLLLGGLGLFGLGSVAFVTPAPLSAVRVSCFAVLAGAGVALVLRSLPGRGSLTLDLTERRLRGPDLSVDLRDARAWVLSGSDTAHPAYRVEVELASGARHVVLERPEPAGVVADLRKLLEAWDLPVQAGWGLPATAAPWRADREGGPSWRPRVPAVEVTAELRPAQRASAVGVLLSMLAMATLMTLMFVQRWWRHGVIGTLSVALSVIVVLALVVIGVKMLTDRIRVRRDDGVTIERLGLGARRLLRRCPLQSVRAAYAVSPDYGEPRHVLVASDDGVWAIPCSGPGAHAVVRALTAPPQPVA